MQKFYIYNSSLLIKKKNKYPVMQFFVCFFFSFIMKGPLCLPYIFTNPLFQANMKSDRIDKLMLYNGCSRNFQWRNVCDENCITCALKILFAIIRNGVLHMPGLFWWKPLEFPFFYQIRDRPMDQLADQLTDQPTD